LAELAFSVSLNVSCTEKENYRRMTARMYNVPLIRVDRYLSHARNPNIST